MPSRWGERGLATWSAPCPVGAGRRGRYPSTSTLGRQVWDYSCSCRIMTRRNPLSDSTIGDSGVFLNEAICMRILLYLLIGLVIGSISGALGIGGGVLLVPALIWLCKFDMTRAAGTSLAVLVPPIGLPAAWKFYVEKRIDLDAALWIALAFAVGAYLSAAMVHQIPQQVMRSAFGFIMIYIAAIHRRVGFRSELCGSRIVIGRCRLVVLCLSSCLRKTSPGPPTARQEDPRFEKRTTSDL